MVWFAGMRSPTLTCLSAVVYPNAKDKEMGLTCFVVGFFFFNCHADNDHQSLQNKLLKMKSVKSLLLLSSFKCE